MDYKGLIGFYHSFKKEMDIITRCKDNFRFTYESDKLNEVIGLINGAKLDSSKIEKKIGEIEIIKKEIDEIKIDDLGIVRKNRAVRSLEEEIDALKNKNNSQLKKLEKFDSDIKIEKENIKEKLEEMGFRVE